MPTFLYPLPLALIAGLIALPIVIHLINMMRHRRIQWAAMEFLLVSQKRNRTWVMLKQFLLMAARVAVVAGVLLLVTQPIVQNKLGGLFGGGKVHHVVLLDDSFSMADRWADTSAFDEAKAVIGRLGAQAAIQPARQEMTLLRFSSASRPSRGTQPDLVNQPVTGEFPKQLEELLGRLKVSELSAGPGEALQAALQITGEGTDVNNIVYVVSDFRAKDWSSATELQKQLKKLTDAGAVVQLINCVDQSRPNLAITTLRPAPGTRAAGVPLQMELTVQNFGPTAASNVSIRLDEQGAPRPAVEIDEIKPGESVTRQFEIRAGAAGQRRVMAQLPSDPVAIDNVRHAVVDFSPGIPVLIVDGALAVGDARDGDGYFLASAFLQPGSVATGLRPRIEGPRFLDDHPLDEFHSVFLCNIDRLPMTSVEKLTKYVEQGGGLAFFVGDRSRADFLNQLYGDDNGLFPVPVEAPVGLLVEQMQKAPDLQVTSHPIFRIFAGESNPFIKTVNVERYFAVKKGWKPAEGSTTQIIARLRNGAPLAVEKQFGAGRVVAVLTTAAPDWNNWARNNPSFVVTMLELQNYLAAARQTDPSRQVGAPLEVAVDPQQYQPQVEFVAPLAGATERFLVKAEAPQAGGAPQGVFSNTDASGIYEIQLLKNDETPHLTAVAYNVDAAEGDLTQLTQEQLKKELPEVAFQFHHAGDLYFDAQQLQGFNLSELVLYLLVFLLIGEQFLAYLTSYHPARLQGAT